MGIHVREANSGHRCHRTHEDRGSWHYEGTGKDFSEDRDIGPGTHWGNADGLADKLNWESISKKGTAEGNRSKRSHD